MSLTGVGAETSGYVYLYRYDADGEVFTYANGLAMTAPGYSATFTDLAPGRYYGEYYDDGGRYYHALTGGAAEAPVEPTDPGTFTVASGQAATATIAMRRYYQRQTMTGRVVDLNGAPVADVDVNATLAGDEDDTDYGYTNSLGEYSLGLVPGTWTLTFEDSTGDRLPVTRDVVVTEGATDLGSTTMAARGRHDLSGSVRTPEGAAPSDSYVTLYRVTTTNGSRSESFVDEAEPATDGSYSFTDVRGGYTYSIVVVSPYHRRTWLGGVSTLADAQLVTPSADVDLGALTLRPAASVRGTVTAPAGVDVDGVEVELYEWSEESEDFEYDENVYTREDGNYDVSVTRNGTYALRFVPRPPLAATWFGGARPTGPTSPGTVQIADATTTVVRDQALRLGPTATGRLVDGTGTPLTGGAVAVYAWLDDGDGSSAWVQQGTTEVAGDGTFTAGLPEDSTITLRFSSSGYQPRFLGGGTALPAAPDATNSRTTTTSTTPIPLGDVALPPRVSSLGKVAGQRLDYCDDQRLPANDDGSSPAVSIPFPLKYFGTEYQRLWVNNNGNVTFSGPQSTYTPSDLTGPTAQPIIAPFFADVDTGGVESAVVTYGVSPDQSTLCVNWADVGYFSERDDKLNTVQLLLRRNDSGSGRVAGDFDITFNYDEVLWETGEASGGTDGFGGTSAAVGFSAGTGEAGTFVQLPGSFVDGALLDGGANALVAGSQGSTQPGRYVFQVRNDGRTSSLGGIRGTVVDEGDDPVEDAYVQACSPTGGCSYTGTSATGGYSFTAVPAGTYAIRVFPPDDSLFGGGAEAVVPAGEVATVAPIVLRAPEPIPDNATLTSLGETEAGVPVVDYRAPLTLRVQGCPGVASPTTSVRLASGLLVRDRVPMVESPAGVYTVTLQPLTPNTGDALISTTVPATCNGAPTEFNIYIDPSGIVTDQYGRPIENAKVTLSRADVEAGPYTVVPDGSAIMSPSNRANPSFTDATGYFRWDVTPGWYKVLAEATGCASTTTPGLEVPPERIDLVIKLVCEVTAPRATAPATLTGTVQVGQTIVANHATWPAPLQGSALEILRDGVSLGVAEYTLTGDDEGSTFSARSTGRRPDYVTENGEGAVVTFDPVTSTTTPVTATAGAAPRATSAPRITGTAQVGGVLTASPGTWSVPGTTHGYQWRRAGSVISGATGATYRPTPADAGQALTVLVTATADGYGSGSAVTGPVTVAKLRSTLAAKLLPAAVRASQRGTVTLTVKVAGVRGPLGTVKVVEGRRTLVTGRLTANRRGVVRLTLPRLSVGRHRLVASYAGNGATTGATARAVTLTVRR